jgi:P27 family predicted phage terminase small subunit
MKYSAPKAPPVLSPEAKSWWRKINDLYQLDDVALLVLRGAMESLDLMRQAQKAVAAEGLTVRDRFSQQKANPNLLTLRDAKASLLSHLRQLGLDLEPLNDGPGRPGGR